MKPRKKRNSKSSFTKAGQRMYGSGSLEYSQLENRQMLTTFLINSLADDGSAVADGQLTLREAVIAAETNAAFGDAPAGQADGDAIRFDDSLTAGTITLSQGELAISDDISILGGSSGITIDANSNSRIFDISTSERVVIRDLNLTNGVVADNGGAIRIENTGTVVLNNLQLTNSQAMGAGGGAISIDDAIVRILNSSFVDNSATGDLGIGGAALVSSGDVRFSATTVSANTAVRAGGGVAVIGGQLEFFRSTLGGPSADDGNMAGNPSSISNEENGGGLYAAGGSGTVVRMVESSIQNNVANTSGGGVFNHSESMLTIRDSLFEDNVAMTGGGGVFNDGGVVRLQRSVVSSNRADGTTGSGGGVSSTGGFVTIVDSTVASNSAIRAGGGIEIVGGQLLFSRSTLGGDAPDDGNVAGSVVNTGNGGGLHVSGTDGVVAVLRESVVQRNTAFENGGGIWNQVGSTLRVLDSEISYNVARGSISDDGGGGIFNSGTLRIRDSVVSGNTALVGSARGGGILTTEGVVSIRRSTIASNEAIRAGGGVEIAAGRVLFEDSTIGGIQESQGNKAGTETIGGNGGGVHISGSNANVSIRGSSVSGNSARFDGGGIWVQEGSTLNVSLGSMIIGNSAAGSGIQNGGGGIFNNGGAVIVSSSTIANNQAAGAIGSGGGVLSFGGETRVGQFSEIIGNTANGNGGGVVVVDGLLGLTDSTVSGNSASRNGPQSIGNGGGLYVSGENAEAEIFRSIIGMNNVRRDGGGIWVGPGSRLNLTNNSSITNNRALGNGGGIHGDESSITISLSNLSLNSALKNGGGINTIGSGFASIRASTIFRNNARQGGGWYNSAELFVTDTSLVFNHAELTGGGIFTESTGTTTVSRSNFFRNVPDDEG